MAGINELKAKIQEDEALMEQFKAAKSIDDVVEIAEKAGFEISAEDIEKLTDISAEELASAAGGAFIVSAGFKIIAKPSRGFVSGN